MNHCRNSFRHFRVFGHNHFSNGRLIAKLSKIYKKIVSLGKMSQLPTVFQGKPNLRKGFFERHVSSEFCRKMAVFRESFKVFIPRKSTDSSLIHHVSLKLTIWYMRDIFFFLPIWSVKYGWFINFHMTRISLLPFCTPFSSHILHIEALLLRQQKIGKTNGVSFTHDITNRILGLWNWRTLKKKRKHDVEATLYQERGSSFDRGKLYLTMAWTNPKAKKLNREICS